MMVSPALISASSAPSASPLKSCETKFDQVITGRLPGPEGRRGQPAGQEATAGQPSRASRPAAAPSSGGLAELTSEGVRLLHQRQPRVHFEDFPEILLVLHVARLLSSNDGH